MATIKVKVAREGLVAKAHRNADVGETSGDSVVYEIENCPEGAPVDAVIAAFRKYSPAAGEYWIDYAKLPAA